MEAGFRREQLISTDKELGRIRGARGGIYPIRKKLSSSTTLVFLRLPGVHEKFQIGRTSHRNGVIPAFALFRKSFTWADLSRHVKARGPPHGQGGRRLAVL